MDTVVAGTLDVQGPLQWYPLSYLNNQHGTFGGSASCATSMGITYLTGSVSVTSGKLADGWGFAQVPTECGTPGAKIAALLPAETPTGFVRINLEADGMLASGVTDDYANA
eukprot:6132854-Prymnesium_polylepis.1